MKKIILGILIVANSYLFASIEREVDAQRFERKNGVLIDRLTGLWWQDNKDAKNVWKDWYGAKKYCSNLVLGGRSDWRLPTTVESKQAYKIRKKFINLKRPMYSYYWSSTSDSSYAWYVGFNGGRNGWERKSYSLYVRCVRGSKIDNLNSLNHLKKQNKTSVIQKLYKKHYNEAKSKSTIEAYQDFIDNYPNAPQIENVKKRIQNIYDLAYNKVKKINSIESYYNFIKKYPEATQKKQAIENIYKLIKQKYNIIGYEWFVKKFPKVPEAKEALNNIYKLAFDKAKEIDTIKAYNTFIYNYPLAPQVKEANERAYKMEEKKYTDLGMLSFYDKDKKMEKKARKLLIKAKQIERYPTDNDIEDRKAGYLIVANRMYRLLQDKFDDTDATLRYLESQEFKDFTRSFRNIMSDIKDTLHAIQNNTSSSSRYMKQLVEVSSKGFAEANADRDMASYYTKQHREWEKYMHFRDKGYR